MTDTQRVPEAAVIAAAKRRDPLLSTYYEGEQTRCLNEAKRDLQAAYPAILSDLRSRLLSDEAVEAVARGSVAEWDHFDAEEKRPMLDHARAGLTNLSAALDTLEEEKG